MWARVNERILSVKKRPALADIERFKSNVKGENEGEKHPANCIDSARGMKCFTANKNNQYDLDGRETRKKRAGKRGNADETPTMETEGNSPGK